MAEQITRSCLYRSRHLIIGEYCCRPNSAACGGEEHSDTNTIVFIQSGAFLKHLHGEDVLADVNQVLFFAAGQPYRVSHPIAGGDICTTFTVDPQTLVDLVAEDDPAAQDHPERPFRFSHGPSDRASHWRYRQLLAAMSGHRQDDLAIEESALDLLRGALQTTWRARGDRVPRRRPAAAQFQRERVEAVRLLLGERFHDQVDLNQLARAVHCSPYHLCRLFKRETGLAIHQYRNRLRLRTALHHLADPRQDLTRLALDLGYFDLSHFSNAFRQEFGLPPSECRRRFTARQLAEQSKKFQAKRSSEKLL
jgi:AraC-like DNA-binding protein